MLPVSRVCRPSRNTLLSYGQSACDKQSACVYGVHVCCECVCLKLGDLVLLPGSGV